jgi:hypothetical protein
LTVGLITRVLALPEGGTLAAASPDPLLRTEPQEWKLGALARLWAAIGARCDAETF